MIDTVGAVRAEVVAPNFAGISLRGEGGGLAEYVPVLQATTVAGMGMGSGITSGEVVEHSDAARRLQPLGRLLMCTPFDTRSFFLATWLVGFD